MKILGVDPGYDRCGIAVIECGSSEKLLYSHCITSDKNQLLSNRLHAIGERFSHIVTRWKPDVVAIETIYFSNNHKTAMTIAEVRGMLSYISIAKNLPVHSVTPLQVKQAVTGYGMADKKQVSNMAARLLNLENSNFVDDEYDAMAVALTAISLIPTDYPQ